MIKSFGDIVANVIYIRDLGLEGNSDELYQIINGDYQVKSSSFVNKKYAIHALLEINFVKTLIHLGNLIIKDIEGEKYHSSYLKILKEIDLKDEKEALLDQLFEAVITIQGEYFDSMTAARNSGYYSTSYYPYNKASKTLSSIARVFGYTLRELITRNVIRILSHIFPKLEPNEPFDLVQISKQCRIPEEKMLIILRNLFKVYPELGELDEISITFTPTDKVLKFNQIVKIDDLEEKLF